MTAPDIRLATLAALTKTAFEGMRLDEALDLALGDVSAPRDQALARAIAYGTCRQWHRLAHIRNQLLRRALKPRDRELSVILLMGLHQLLDLRIPDHAAVNESVALARRAGYPWAAKMVNAVLRRAAREAPALERQLQADPAARHSHPRWLLDALRACWPQRWQAIAMANNQHPPMTLRVNPGKSSLSGYLARLREAGMDATAQAHLPQAVSLARPVDVNALPGFDRGMVSVQDGAAQLAAMLLPVASTHRVLDACAAPGGKTAHLLERHPELAELVAVDSMASRVERLQRGLTRLGLGGRARCLVRDARLLHQDFPHGHFQAILLDAPCTATGVIRRHPDIKLHRDLDALRNASVQQRELLDSLWPLLARRGTLLYATCSVLSAENEGLIDAFLAECHDAKPVTISLPFGSPRGAGHQILPGEAGMDGFFYALLAKS